jgi:hypothetical protein
MTLHRHIKVLARRCRCWGDRITGISFWNGGYSVGVRRYGSLSFQEQWKSSSWSEGIQ